MKRISPLAAILFLGSMLMFLLAYTTAHAADFSKSMPASFKGAEQHLNNQIFPTSIYINGRQFSANLGSEGFPGDNIGYRGRKKDGLYGIELYRPDSNNPHYEIWQGATWERDLSCKETGTVVHCSYID